MIQLKVSANGLNKAISVLFAKSLVGRHQQKQTIYITIRIFFFVSHPQSGKFNIISLNSDGFSLFLFPNELKTSVRESRFLFLCCDLLETLFYQCRRLSSRTFLFSIRMREKSLHSVCSFVLCRQLSFPS